MGKDSAYQIEYNVFLANYKKGITTGEDVGVIICKLVQYFSEANSKYGDALINFNNKAANIECTTDENGKTISSSKAKVMADATEEASILTRVKIDLQNVEEMINGLKALQRGVLNEMAHSSNY